MMDYQVFKEVIAERLGKELPPIYSDYKVEIFPVRKVNGEKDAIVLRPPENRIGEAVPTLYVDDFYEMFRECEDLDEVMKYIINIFVQYTGMKVPGLDDFDFSSKMDSLVMNLINTEMNRGLLENVPHKDFLDLSIVYRFIVSEDENGFGTVMLGNDMAEHLDMGLEEIHHRAYENTMRMFPLKVSEAFRRFYVVSNERFLSGASTIICEEYLKQLAEKIGSDYYIIPGSIHEVYAVPADEHDVGELLRMLNEGNNTYASRNEILSRSIYYYDGERASLGIAGFYEEGDVVKN